MTDNIGFITSVNGSLIEVSCDFPIQHNEVGYVTLDEKKVKAEIIQIKGKIAKLQVFESTLGIKLGDKVNFTNELLSVSLGPGILGQIYDGLQNPLRKISDTYGFFLPRGVNEDALDQNQTWEFNPSVKTGEEVRAGDILGYVKEGIFTHNIMVPFNIHGEVTIKEIMNRGNYKHKDKLGFFENTKGKIFPFYMSFNWPVKIPIKNFRRKLLPKKPLTTGIRVIDSFFPVARGGAYCIPGPFGAGKTVLQQITSRYAEVDVVVIAACGERAGEVVETLREFPKMKDPRTGQSLMNRTVMICNTSSMPVAAREASIYTAVTIAEYYRQMGLHVLLLADSTTRWAMALREVSGNLEEIPGEEAFPAYLESRIASFYERAGEVELEYGQIGSVTIGGTVSPAGGNFEEPVTQATLKVVGAFHGLSRERAYSRRFPAIDPLDSWSRYPGNIDSSIINEMIELLKKGDDIGQMMKVVGEEGITQDDYLIYLKSELIDQVYLQQNSFHSIDAFTSMERQKYLIDFIFQLIHFPISLSSKSEARKFYHRLTQTFIDWNYCEFKSVQFEQLKNRILSQFKNEPQNVEIS